MNRPTPAALAAAALLSMTTHGCATDSPQHHHSDAPGDSRFAVKFPGPLRDHTLANMRDHLLTLQRIQDDLGRGAFDSAAQLAETRLGLSSLEAHGAHEVAMYMPQGMQDMGMQMHRAASRFALEAANAGATRDVGKAVQALAEVTSHCVACHATYRLD